MQKHADVCEDNEVSSLGGILPDHLNGKCDTCTVKLLKKEVWAHFEMIADFDVDSRSRG